MRYHRYLKCLLFVSLLVTPIPLAAQRRPTEEKATVRPTEEKATAATLNRLFQEGAQAYSSADYTTALEKWQAALVQARTLKNIQYTSQLLMNIGVVSWYLGKYEQALESLQEARILFKQLGSLQGEGQILNNIGLIQQTLGRHHDALHAYEEALTIKEQTGDRQGASNTLGNIGSVYIALGHYEQAQASFEQALTIAREIGEKRLENMTLTGTGQVFWYMGQYRKALERFEQALAIARDIGDRQGESNALSGLGLSSVELGQYDRAFESFRQALAIARSSGNRKGESQALNNIGVVYQKIGQHEHALSHYEKALEIEQAIGHRKGESQALNNIGTVHDDLQCYEQALDYYAKALAIFQELKARPSEGTLLSNIGTVYSNQGEIDRALEYYEKSLAIKRELGDRRGESLDLNNIGQLYEERGEYTQAYPLLNESLDICRDIGAAELLWIAQSGLASAVVGLERYNEALTLYEQALDTIESLRTGLSQKEAKSSFIQNKLFVYDEFITLLHTLHQKDPEKGYDRKALEIFERKQGRVFLEEIGKSGARFFAGVPKEPIQREQELEHHLQQVNQQISDERAKGGIGESQQRVEKLELLREDLKTELHNLQTTFEAKYPDYYALKYPKPATISDLQNQVLQADELMLAYNVMEESTVVWFVSPETLQMYSLPVGEKILQEDISKVREAMIKDWGTERGLNLSRITAQDDSSGTGSFPDMSYALYEQLIPETVRPLLIAPEGEKRVLHIVPSGPLYNLPFEALLTQSAHNLHYLIEDIPIGYLSSASLLKTLRETQARRAPAAQHPLLAFAHPAYRGELPAEEEGVQTLRTRFYRTFFRDRLTELPETAEEAKAVAQLLNATEESAPLQLREDASRANVLDLNQQERLDDYQYLLFAMHGVLPGEVDRVAQSALILSDDFLTMADVFGLQLNARLVSLSACNTGRGTKVKGEGVLGLTRAFMYAGTPVVAVTLWSVESLSAKELDIGFFQHLKAGMPAAEALQAVKVGMLRGKYDRTYRSPYYWAPFVLFGDGK